MSPPPPPASFRSSLIRWFEKHGRDLPWRRTTDPYAILVSEMMLQQTQVTTVLPFYERWMRRFPTVRALAAAAEEDVLHAWQGLGYYSRARNLHRTARAVVEDHAGTFPNSPEALGALPGIGPYTAGAVAAFAFDRPVPLVDANIARVLARLMDLRHPIDSGAGRNALWDFARRLQPPGVRGGRRFNSALMELGALVCTPRDPDCEGCPVRRHCRASDPAMLPIKKPRQRGVERLEDRAWCVRDGKLLTAAEPGNRWRGLRVLPRLLRPPRSGAPLHIARHPVMHFRITLRIWKSAKVPAQPDLRWTPLAELDTLAMPSPHRRAVDRLRPLSDQG